MVWNTYRVSVPVPYVFSPCPSRFDHTPWFSGRCRSVLPKRWGSPTRQSYGIVIYMCGCVCVCGQRAWGCKPNASYPKLCSHMCFIWKCFVENIIELPASSCVYVYNPPYYIEKIYHHQSWWAFNVGTKHVPVLAKYSSANCQWVSTSGGRTQAIMGETL